MLTHFFQDIINQFQGVLNMPLGVIDGNSKVVACNSPGMIGTVLEEFPKDKAVSDSSFIYNGVTYKVFLKDMTDVYTAFIFGSESSCITYIELISVALYNTINMKDEKRDKCNFIKSIVLDNILPGDVYLKAHELGFDSERRRVCILIKTKTENRPDVYELISSLFPEKSKDFVINVNDTDLVLVKEVSEDVTLLELEKLSGSICDTLLVKKYIYATVGIGRIVDSLKELATSFKEAQIALEIGKIFEIERSVVSYEQLGIARLIYQVPTTICKMFLNEVFDKGTVDDLDGETLFTIQAFFENSLNVSETSRRLFVHRNTLVYRLEKIYRVTGLDLRIFEHAVLFKIAMLVSKYISENPIKY